MSDDQIWTPSERPGIIGLPSEDARSQVPFNKIKSIVRIPDEREISRVMDILNELGSKNKELYKLLDDPGWVGGVRGGLLKLSITPDTGNDVWKKGYSAGQKMLDALKDTEWTHEEIRARIFNSLAVNESGEVRTTSSTGAEKGVKPARYDLIPIPALDQLARLYGKGAEKYAEHNWRKGYEYSKSYAAAMRHMALFWAGEDIDEEMGLPHVICASFHMFALATFLQEHPEFDDRFVVAEKLKEVQGVIAQGVSPGS